MIAIILVVYISYLIVRCIIQYQYLSINSTHKMGFDLTKENFSYKITEYHNNKLLRILCFAPIVKNTFNIEMFVFGKILNIERYGSLVKYIQQLTAVERGDLLQKAIRLNKLKSFL